MSNVLLTVSGEIEPDLSTQIAERIRPRADYVEMVAAFGADIIDYTKARQMTGTVGRILEKIGGPNLVLAWACFQQRGQYKVVFTDGEQIGIPLALLCKFGGQKGMHHLMIVHILSVGKKMLFFDLFRIQRHIDMFFVYSTWQKRFIEGRWHVQPERVKYTPFMVDHLFFSLQQVTPKPRRMICAVGLEFRDYPTLMEAVRGVDVEVIIVAASKFSKRKDSTENHDIPENVTVSKLSLYELRQVYADCMFVVIPLYNVNFSAGATSILEAMSMEKAVVCSRTPGQTDLVIDGETGLYVPPEDPQALRQTIEHLLDNPQLAAQMGQAGRRLIENEMNLDSYANRLGSFVQAAVAT